MNVMEKKIIIVALLALSLVAIPVFQNANALTTVYYNETDCNTSLNLSQASGMFRVTGEGLRTTNSALKDDTVNQLTVALRKVGNPTGTVYFAVWRTTSTPTSSNMVYTFGTMSAVDLTASFVDYTELNNSTSYTLQVNDVVGVGYFVSSLTDHPISCQDNDGAGSGGPFDGTDSGTMLFSTSWLTSEVGRADMIMNIAFNDAGTSDPFCSILANQNLLTCRLQSQPSLAGASQLTNQSATDISCQVGIIACTNGVPNDTNIQTNGVGYILLFVALAIWVGLLWVASRGQIADIPNFVWMLGTIAVVGAVTVVGWIDPTIFIVSIITVIALAGIKAKNIFGGAGGMFKGEES